MFGQGGGIMAKITIESINEELEQYGWSCVSETYKNLETELEFLCEEGYGMRALEENSYSARMPQVQRKQAKRKSA